MYGEVFKYQLFETKQIQHYLPTVYYNSLEMLRNNTIFEKI